MLGKAFIAGGVLGTWIAGTYIADVILRPYVIAGYARELARQLGKPLLNVGAGTRTSSLRCALLGPTTWGDVNLDVAAVGTRPGPGSVSAGDIMAIPYPDRHFGVAIASHVLEHLERPDLAMNELHRVADYVIVILPRWWAFHTWAHPGHRWFIDQAGHGYKLWGWGDGRKRIRQG
ncbi:MAG: methyltransferase domain-containing protein [Pseudomonadota bacterium]